LDREVNIISEQKEYFTFSRHVIYVIVANIIVLLIGIVRIPILTRALGADMYGIWALILATVSLMVPFALIGFSMSIIRFLAAEKNRDRIRDDFISACIVVFISGCVFSLLIFLLSDILATSLFNDPESAYYFKIGSVLIPLNCLMYLCLAFFRMRRRMGTFTVMTITHQSLTLGLIVSFIALGWDLKGVIIGTAAAIMLVDIVGLYLVLKETGIRVPDFSNIKTYLKWGIPLTPNAAILWIINSSDRYIISHFLGSTATGLYTAAYNIGVNASFMLVPVQMVLYPNLVKTYAEGNPQETQKYLRYSVKYLMMISIPAAVGLSVLGRALLQLLATPEFVSANTVIPYIAAGIVLYNFFQTTVTIFHITDHTHITIRLLVTSALLNIGLNVILIPRMDIEGAAVATLVAYGVLGLLTIIVTRRYLKFDLNLFFILKSIAASGVMGLCIWLIDPTSIAMVFASIAIGVVVYFTTLIMLKGVSRNEIDFFAGFARENIRRIFFWTGSGQ